MAHVFGFLCQYAILFVMYDQIHSAIDITVSRKAAITREASKIFKLLIGSIFIAENIGSFLS